LPPVRPNIIDFEASGFGFDSYPIEVGVILDTGQKYCSLIKPANDWLHWDRKAEKIHGLCLETVHAHGKPISTVTTELNAFIGERTVFSDGWVVDKAWLSKLYYRCGMIPSFLLSPLEMILKEEQMDMWEQTKLQVIDDLNLFRHRASTDALIIQETYFRTRQPVQVAP
jgi:hypothetical protein